MILTTNSGCVVGVLEIGRSSVSRYLRIEKSKSPLLFILRFSHSKFRKIVRQNPQDFWGRTPDFFCTYLQVSFVPMLVKVLRIFDFLCNTNKYSLYAMKIVVKSFIFLANHLRYLQLQHEGLANSNE